MTGAVFAIRGADEIVKRLEASARAASDWMPKKAASSFHTLGSAT